MARPYDSLALIVVLDMPVLSTDKSDLETALANIVFELLAYLSETGVSKSKHSGRRVAAAHKKGISLADLRLKSTRFYG